MTPNSLRSLGAAVFGGTDGPLAQKQISAAGMEKRIKVLGGDFFKDDLPKADVITMGNILHDWNLENKKVLIQKAYAALPKGGALIAIENLIDDARRENAFGLLMSLNMLIEFGDAFDYTAADFRNWCGEAGFKRFEVLGAGDEVDVFDHPNQIRYPGQRVSIVLIDDYAYLVPFIESTKVAPGRSLVMAFVVIATAALSACAIFPPGEDDKGVEMKRQATPVLVALANYRKDRGEYPTSLHELVPKYIAKIPFGPNLEFSRKEGVLSFVYQPSWPEINDVYCLAAPGDVQWTCTGGR